MENKNLLEIQKLNVLFSQKEQELEGELFKLRESSEEQRQHSERQYKESIEKLSNEYNMIEQKLKLQSDISTNHLAKLVQKEKEFADKENAFFALILDIKNKKHTQAQKHLESLVLREREFNEKLEQLRLEAHSENLKMRDEYQEEKKFLVTNFDIKEYKLFSQIESIHQELTTQNNISTEHLVRLATREKEFASQLNQIISEKYTVELQLHRELAEHQELLSDLRQKLIRLRSSVSWKLTAPLRAIGSLLISDQSDTLAIAGNVCRSYIKQSPSEVDLPPIHELIAIPEPIGNLNTDYKETIMTSSPIVAATSLDELIAYHDADFVHCAYITLLGRSPDPEGMRYYLGRVRAGRAKIAIVNQIVSSTEAKIFGVNITDINVVLRQYRLEKMPIIGVLFQKDTIVQEIRQIESSIYLLNQDMNRRFNIIEQALGITSVNNDVLTKLNDLNGLKQLSPSAREIYIQLKNAVKNEIK